MDERIVSQSEIPPLPGWAVEISPSIPKQIEPQKLPSLPDWAREEFPKASDPNAVPLPTWAQEISPTKQGQISDQYRLDGTKKGPGFLGTLKRPDGRVSTELSIGVNIGGKETLIPALVPTLTKEEVDSLLSDGPITDQILNKAVAHAKTRMSQGKSPFAGPDEELIIERPDETTRKRMQMIESGRVPFEEPGLGTFAIKAGKQLAETPINIIKGGIAGAKGVIQRPKEFLPAMKEAYDYATSHEGQKEMLRAGYKNATELVAFLPKTAINFVKNPAKQVMDDPVGTIFLMSAVGGGVAGLIGRKLRAKIPIKPEEMRAAITDVEAYQTRLEEMKPLSARKPEEITTWSEMPREPKVEPSPWKTAPPVAAGTVPEAGKEFSVNVKPEPDGSMTITRKTEIPKVPEVPKISAPIPDVFMRMPMAELEKQANAGVEGAKRALGVRQAAPTAEMPRIRVERPVEPKIEVGTPVAMEEPGIVAPAKAEAVITKEPWQMTRKEFIALEPAIPGVKPDHRMYQRGVQHSIAVIDALEAGQDVPSNVLKDYPDLIARFKKPEIKAEEIKPQTEMEEPARAVPEKPVDFELRRQLAATLQKMNIPREKWGEISRRVLENYTPEEGNLENYIRKTAFGRTKAGVPILTEEGEPWPRKEAPKEISLEKTKELAATEVTERPLMRSEEEGRVKNILLRQAKDKIDEDILVRRFFDYESYESLGHRYGISRQAIEKRINESLRKLKADPEAEAVKDYLKQKEYLELNAGIPLTKEIGDAVKKIKERTRQKELVKAEQIKNELQKTDEGKVEWMYLETDRQFKEKREPTFRKAIESAKRALVDTSGNIKKKLIDDLDSLGKEAVIDHDLIAGASAKSERLFSEASDKIYKGLSKDQETLLNKTIQSRRTISISKYNPDIKHPFGLSAKEHAAFLKKVPKEINDRADLYFKEMQNQLDELKSEGLINKEQYDSLKAKGDYSPRWFINHIDPESITIIGGKKITVPDSGIKSLDEGSLKVMETNSRRLLSNVIGRTQGRIFRNRANKSLWKITEEFPENEIVKKAPVIKETKEGKPIYEPAPGGFTKIKTVIDGEAKEMLMPDKFAKEWVTRDPLINEHLSTIIGWLSGTKVLKPMATGLNPEFALTNMPRDIAHAWLTTSEYSSVLPKAALQFAKDFTLTAKDAFSRKGRWIDYIDEGGGMSFLTHQGRITKNAGVLKPLQNLLGWVGETSEIWTRLALRDRAIKNGKSPKEATWIARNYIDFSQGGNVAKALDTGIPYLNAAVQGTRGLFRALGDRPVDTMWKFAEIGALASGLYLANKYYNSDCWKQVPDREKVNNFIITTPFTYKDANENKRNLYFKVAKDQAQRVICTAFENLMAKATGEKVNADQITQSVADFMPVVPTDLLPPSMEAFFGYIANKDFWTNKDIWKGPKVEPKEEYTRYTHPEAVEAGKITGLSPERLSYSLSQFFTKGNIYTSLVSGGFSLAFKDLDKPTQEKMMQETIERLPFIRRVFRSTPPYSEKELKEEEKQKTEETTRRYSQQREFDNLLARYYDKKEKETLKEIKSYIAEQPVDDRKRLVNRFYYFASTQNLPDRSWWLNLIGTPSETRANIFWGKYMDSDAEEKREMIKIAKKIPGIWSSPFVSKFNILIKQNRRTLESEK